MQLFCECYPVGEIIADESSDPVFRDDPAWLAQGGAFPLSTTMPLRSEPWDWPVLAPWLINLLPEDSDVIRVMARILDVPHTDVLGRVGRDISGAISFAERGATGCDVREVASEENHERIIDELPRKPFLAGEDGVSMLLAGVQSKLAVRVLEGGRIAIPLNGTASSHILKPASHILKPDSDRLWGGVHNEALCLTLARLTWDEGRIEHRVRFGTVSFDRVLDRRSRLIGFAPGSIFAFVRWASNDYGTIILAHRHSARDWTGRAVPDAALRAPRWRSPAQAQRLAEGRARAPAY